MPSLYDATAQTKVADPSTTQTTISPITGQPILTRSLPTSNSQLDSLLEASQTAYLSWRAVPLQQRIDIVTKGIAHLAARAPELATEITEQMGRPIRCVHSVCCLSRPFDDIAALISDPLTPPSQLHQIGDRNV